MKIECVKDKLLEAVNKAEKLCGKNLSLPILASLALIAEKQTVTIKATNLDLGIEIELPAKILEPGTITVPANILSQFLQNLSGEDKVVLEEKDGTLKVTTERTATTIKTTNFDDFPIIPKVSGKSLEIEPQEFVRGLKAVAYSSAITSMKPELSSVYIYEEDGKLTFVATDSFRLAEKRISVKKSGDFGSLLIPFRNVNEIVRLLEGVKEKVKVTIHENQISFSWPGYYLVSRVIDGTFPDYKQIIPKEAKTEVIVLKEDLIRSLKLANVFSDSFNQIAIKVLPHEKLFEITTKNNDVGENHNALVATVTGEDLTLSFNYRYIADCFQSIPTDSVSLSFHGIGKPLIIRGVGDSTFLYLAMPMNK